MTANIIISYVLALSAAGSTFAANYQLRHDPFSRPTLVMPKAMNITNTGDSNNEIELRGVILDGNSSLANISGKIVRLRQNVSGYTVTAIERNKVTLDRNGNITILTVNDDE